MRILLVTSELPDPAAGPGGGEPTWPWVRELAGTHSYSLLSFLRPEDETRLAGIREYFEVIRTVPAGPRGLNRLSRFPRIIFHPFPVAAACSRRFQAALEEMLAEGAYDCVQLEKFPMGQYSRRLPETVSRVLVYRDLAGEVLRRQVWLARGLKKYYYYREWKLSSHREKWYAIWSRNVLVTSLKDRRTVDSWDIGVKIFTLPPLLDPGLLVLPAEKRDGETVLFSGSFNRPGTIDAVIRLKEEIMPRVRRECPGSNSLIVGANPPAEVRRLAAADFIVSGDTERLPEHLSTAAVLAVPLRVTGGLVPEIVEAMTAACPVVSTRSASVGLGARDEDQILLADRADDFAAAVLRLLKSPGERERLGWAGRNLVREKFDRKKSREKMEDIYRRIVSSGR